MKSKAVRVFEIAYSKDGQHCLETCPQVLCQLGHYGCEMLNHAFFGVHLGDAKLVLKRPDACREYEAAWKKQVDK